MSTKNTNTLAEVQDLYGQYQKLVSGRDSEVKKRDELLAVQATHIETLKATYGDDWEKGVEQDLAYLSSMAVSLKETIAQAQAAF